MTPASSECERTFRDPQLQTSGSFSSGTSTEIMDCARTSSVYMCKCFEVRNISVRMPRGKPQCAADGTGTVSNEQSLKKPWKTCKFTKSCSCSVHGDTCTNIWKLFRPLQSSVFVRTQIQLQGGLNHCWPGYCKNVQHLFTYRQKAQVYGIF